MSKYNNKIAYHGNIKFHSIKERDYYRILLLLKKAANSKDRVVKIELQPRFPYKIEYHANGLTHYAKAFYDGDFKVWFADGRIDIIDVKGVKTATYKRKKKIIEKLYKIKIIEK